MRAAVRVFRYRSRMASAGDDRGLGDSAALLGVVLDTVSDAIIAIDAAQIIRLVNRQTTRIFGYSREELVGRHVHVLMPEELRAEHDGGFFRYLAAGGAEGVARHVEVDGVRKDGSRFPLEMRFMSAVTASGERVVTAAARDLTEQRAARAELDHAMAMLRATLDATEDGILAIDPSGRILIANARAREIWRVSSDLFESRSPEERLAVVTRMLEDPSHYLETLRWVVENEVPEHSEVFATRDGRYIERVLRRSRDGDAFRGMVASYRDVTERVRSVHELERMVDERTRELRQKQAELVQSEKMAALGMLVAGVAHEVNTPLGAIKSNNDTVRGTVARLRGELAGSSEAPAAELHEVARVRALFDVLDRVGAVSTEAIDRITKIVQSLRHFARLDAARVDRVDLHVGIESTLTLLGHELRQGITVERDYGDLPRVECFPDRLNQVFMNLLVNAVQAIAGTGRITVRTRALGDQVLVEIEDTGSGIAPEHLPRIFDPGFTTKGVGVGTGLGLSIVHQIVEEHGGHIDVASTPGHGATFRLVLPRTLPRPPSVLPPPAAP